VVFDAKRVVVSRCGSEAESDVAVAQVDAYANDIAWIGPECHDNLDEETRRELYETCRDAFREKLLDCWRDNSPHVDPETS